MPQNGTCVDVKFDCGMDDEEKLSLLFAALSRVADKNGLVESAQLGKKYDALRPWLLKLQARKLVEIIYATHNGIKRIKLLVREFRKKPPVTDTTVYEIPVEVKPKKKVPTRCLVLVDCPNLCHHVVETGVNGVCESFTPVKFGRTHWELLPKIAAELTEVPTEAQQCTLYTKVLDGGSDRFRQRCQELEQKGFAVRPREKKDVDCFIQVDIFEQPLLHILKMGEGEEFKIVLASADGDYAYAIERTRAFAARLGIKVTVYIVVWEHCLSGDLAAAADHVVSIEPYLSRLDPTGAALWRLHREKKAA